MLEGAADVGDRWGGGALEWWSDSGDRCGEVRDDVDRSIFRIAGFENISWPRGGSGCTVTWTKVRLSCAIYSFDPSRGSYRQDQPTFVSLYFEKLPKLPILKLEL